MEKRKKAIRLSIISIILVLVIIVTFLIVKNNSLLSSKKLYGSATNISEEDLHIGEVAEVSEVVIIEKNTGTSPWDEEEGAGNDTDPKDNVVRSFDYVTYTLAYTLSPKDRTSGKSYKGGVILVEAHLPESIVKVNDDGTYDNYVMWDTTALKTKSNVQDVVVSEDGSVLTFKFILSKNDVTVAGNGTISSLKLKVLGAPNDFQFAPTFKLGLAGNSNDEFKTINDDIIRVSAAPKLNVRIKRNSYLDYRGYFDFDKTDALTEASEGAIQGRVQGYGITLQLYNTNSNKKLKGIEIPTGPITFHLTFSEYNGNTDVTNETGYTPVIWDYKENNSSSTGKSGKNMKLGGSSYVHYSIHGSPYNKGTFRRTSCNDGGTWTIEQYKNESNQIVPGKYIVTVNNYKFGDFTFPTNAANDPVTRQILFGENVGSFSAGYVETILQIPEDISSSVTKLTLKATVSNIKATSISNQMVSNDVYADDDYTNNAITLYQPGSLTKYIVFNSADTKDKDFAVGSVGSDKAEARLKTTVGAEPIIASGLEIMAADSPLKAINTLIKFDDEAFEPIERLNENTGLLEPIPALIKPLRITTQVGNLITLYAAKPDGTGWDENVSYEMDDTREEDLIYFSTYSALKKYFKEDLPVERRNNDPRCVGILLQNRGVIVPATSLIHYAIRVRVKNSAKIGETYQTINDLRAWTANLTYSWKTCDSSGAMKRCENGIDEGYPNGYLYRYNEFFKASSNDENKKYVKLEYDKNGEIQLNTHNGGWTYGSSILVVGADLGVTKEITNKTGDTPSYNLGQNEYDVKFKITPTITNEILGTSISGVNLMIKETLPPGLRYEVGSSSGDEPYVEEVGDDEPQTLVWYRYGQKVNQAVKAITYTAHISESTPDSTQYETTTEVQEIVSDGAESKIGNSYVGYRTAVKTINVTNEARTSLVKTTETPVIEVGGQIKFKVIAANTTDQDASDFQLLDILPYNGDGRGTNFSGSYKVEKITISSPESQLENINLYVTDSYDVRSGVTAKDRNLGTTSIWKSVTSGTIIDDSLTGYVVTGNLKANSSIEIEIIINTRGNKAGDIYQNDASAQTNIRTMEIISPIVKSQVVSRLIEGKVWLDKDDNGLIDNKEPFMKDIVVKLLDSNGNYVSSYTTDASGYYKFENMARGKYIIQVEIDNEIYEITDKEIGSNAEKNSKFNSDGKTDLLTKLDSVANTTLKETNVNAGIKIKKTEVTVNHIDKTTNMVIIDDKTGKPMTETNEDYHIGDEYTGHSKNIPGYILVESPKKETIELDKDRSQNILNYYYVKISGGIIEKHIDVLTGDILYNESHPGKVGDEYSINSRKFDDYDLDESNLPKNSSRKMEEELIEVIYYYKRKANVIVKYIDKATGEEISKTETVKGYVKDTYKTEKKDISGYKIISIPSNYEGEMTEEDITVIYYYKKEETLLPATWYNNHTLLWISIACLSLTIFGFMVRKFYIKYFAK